MSRSKYPFLFSSLFLLAWSCQPTTSKAPAANPSKDEGDSSARSVETYTSFEAWLDDPKPLVSAHRGGPYPGFPENAVETFQNVADQMATIIECDIAMTKDSVLILMHDQTVDRTTTGEGKVVDMLYDDVKDLQLVDNTGKTTSFHIPTLDEVLYWGKGRALFTLDVKRGVPFEKVITTIEKYEASSYAAIITYRIQDASKVYALNPDIMISVSAGDDGALAQITKSEIPTSNLLGFVGTREPDVEHYEKVRALGIKTILGTLGNLDKSAESKGDDSVYLTYVENGASIIATDRPLEVAKVLGNN